VLRRRAAYATALSKGRRILFFSGVHDAGAFNFRRPMTPANILASTPTAPEDFRQTLLRYVRLTARTAHLYVVCDVGVS